MKPIFSCGDFILRYIHSLLCHILYNFLEGCLGQASIWVLLLSSQHQANTWLSEPVLRRIKTGFYLPVIVIESSVPLRHHTLQDSLGDHHEEICLGRTRLDKEYRVTKHDVVYKKTEDVHLRYLEVVHLRYLGDCHGEI